LPPAVHLTHSHHHTLHAAIDWSHQLLSRPERVMLRRLFVFVGGWSLSAVETVCAGDGVEREQVLDLLSALVDKSLVVADTLHRTEARYMMLETIRQYAGEKLSAAGEASRTRDRHLQCYLRMTEETVPKLKGRYQQLWLNWLEDEYDNIRTAMAWSLESNRIEIGLRIGIALYQFWTIRDYVEEGLAWLERLLARAGEGTAPVVYANALAYAQLLTGFRGNIAAQIAYGRRAAAWAAEAGDVGTRALIWALSAESYAARAAGDYQSDFAISQRIIQLHRDSGDPYRLGLALSLYSVPAMAVGEFDKAGEMLDEGLRLLREAGDPYRIAMALNYWGDLARCQGDWERAQTAYEESITLLREIDAVRDLASLGHNLGHTVLHLGDVTRAHELFNASIASQQEQGNRPGMAECLIGFAGLAIARDQPAAGVRLLAAAAALGGRQVTSRWAATRQEYKHYLACAGAGLTKRAFQAEQATGRALSLEQAVAYAQEAAGQATAIQNARQKLDSLTAREREVAVLIAQARSNEEIAQQLVISKRTVEKHISNIRSKLAFSQRAQIVRWAMETGLLNGTE
jgi:DNA-binding CsgD family transcriptional regulator